MILQRLACGGLDADRFIAARRAGFTAVPANRYPDFTVIRQGDASVISGPVPTTRRFD